MVIFVAIALASVIFLVGAFIFGHDHDGGHFHDLGHGEVAGEEPTISIFSLKVMCTFTMGFGGAGAIARYYNLSYPASSLVGLVFGVVLGGVMFAILELITKQQASSLIATKSLIGSEGVVTVSIAGKGKGEVGVTFGDQYSIHLAVSKEGRDIAKDSRIRVTGVAGSMLTVEEIAV